MEKAQKILFKAHDFKKVDNRWIRLPLSNEEFEYAISKGIMFHHRETLSHASDTYGIDYCRGHGWDCNWFDVIAIHSMKLIFRAAGGYDHKKENR